MKKKNIHTIANFLGYEILDRSKQNLYSRDGRVFELYCRRRKAVVYVSDSLDDVNSYMKQQPT